jgi:glutathione S-transferase
MKIRKILDYKGIDYAAVEVDYLDRRELLAASGQLMVPALTLDGDTIVDSESIAKRLEELSPEPTIFPAEWRGLHLALARYFEGALEDALFRAAVPDEIAHFREQSPAHEAMWRLIQERKYGSGFCDLMTREHALNSARAEAMLTELEPGLKNRAFLLGRIGYADFALYGQLSYLTLIGENRIPRTLPNLIAFYERMDRISARLEEQDQ